MKSDIFIKACKREQTKRTPIWLMRQAGRYLPEYKKIRERYDFMTMLKTPSIASEVTIQPVEIVGVDAAIIFSDILVVPEAMGMKLFYDEGHGPRFESKIQSEKDVESLLIPDPSEKLSYVLEAIEITKRNIDVPLIGFSGSPWTLFVYMTSSNDRRDYKDARTFIYKEPKLARKLLDKIAKSISKFLIAQIEAGADAVQIFDTWGGILSKDELVEFSLSYIQIVIEDVRSIFKDVPMIVFSKGTWAWIEEIVKTGCDVISIDWTYDIRRAREIVGGKVAIQGNLDPAVLLAEPETVVKEAIKILNKFGHGNGHIFNLGHGVLPETPVENVKILVDVVKRESQKFHK